MGNKFGFLNGLDKFKKTYKRCAALKSKVIKDSYDELLDGIEKANKKLGVKSGKQEVEICQLSAFFQTTKNAIDTWIKVNEKAEDKIAKDRKIMQKYTENLNNRRRYALNEFSNSCKLCVDDLNKIDEYIEKAKKKGDVSVSSDVANEDKGILMASLDAVTGNVTAAVSATTDGVIRVAKSVGGSVWNGLKGGYNYYFGGTPQPPTSKQRCHIVKVFDVKCGDILDLLRCYVCVELNLAFGAIDGIMAPMDFDFKKYELNGKNFEDKCFNDRTIYRIKPVKVTVGKLGDVMLHVFISPNPTKTGELVSTFARKNWITVDGGDLSLFK